jgi:hypothetical protein
MFVYLTASWPTAGIVMSKTLITSDEMHEAVCKKARLKNVACFQSIYSVQFVFCVGRTAEEAAGTGLLF